MLKMALKENVIKYRVEIAIFTLSFMVYYLSNFMARDWYKHYVYLADAFIHGRLDLRYYPNYYQDIVIFEGQSYIPFPPMPAILLTPLVGLFGTNVSQRVMTNFIGALNVSLLWYIFKVLKVRKDVSLGLTILFGFGTVHWYCSQVGTTWFYAHIVAVSFIFFAIIEALTKKRPIIVGLLLGFAAMSRQLTVLSLPFFLLALVKDGRAEWRKILKLIIALGSILLLYSIYNYVRVGNLFDVTYTELYKWYMPGDYQRYSIFDLHWLPGGLYTMLLMPPKLLEGFPYFQPDPEGMSMLLVTPAFLYILKAKEKDWMVIGSWISVILISIPSLMYFNHGWVQFGYRFSLDFTPFLMLLLFRGFEGKMTIGKILLITYSILVNAWGVYWGNVLGW